MKFITVIVVLVGAAAVSARRGTETNAERLARGLPPLPPARRGTPVAFARRSGPSATPNSCDTPLQCCVVLTKAIDPFASQMIRNLRIPNVDPMLDVALGCVPLSAAGIDPDLCTPEPLCCENNNFDGVIALGCRRASTVL